MTAKFRPGDIARVGGLSQRPTPACYRWLKRGRLVVVKGIVGRTKGGHIEYLIAGRRGRPDARLASYELRRPNERDRATGAGRRAAKE
jgi:hypothetical protein